MQARAVWIVMLLAAFGCTSPEKTQFEEKLEWARSSSVAERAIGAGMLNGNCCFPDQVDRDGRLRYRATQVAACGEVGRLLASERENEVLEALISGPYADCYRQFPSTTLARLCQTGPCSMALRRHLVTMLGAGEPDPAITKALLAQLYDGDEAIQTSVAVALGVMGEPDLLPAIEALASTNPVVRRTVASGFAYAVDVRVGGPLDLPALVPALAHAVNDSDPKVATIARIALNDYLAWSPMSAEELVARVERVSATEVAIRLLAVRRFSCQTEAASQALLRMASGSAEYATAARTALALRAERCRNPAQ